MCPQLPVYETYIIIIFLLLCWITVFMKMFWVYVPQHMAILRFCKEMHVRRAFRWQTVAENWNCC